jgi:hypothetical protein
MCETGKNIKLCTCLARENTNTIIHYKNSKRHKKNRLLNPENIYKWTLYRYVGLKDSAMEGLLYPPSYKLGEYLTNEIVLTGINNETCFDFEYKPNEGDNLVIYIDAESVSFMSFIYRNGQWKAASYDGFIDKEERINYGKVVTT